MTTGLEVSLSDKTVGILGQGFPQGAMDHVGLAHAFPQEVAAAGMRLATWKTKDANGVVIGIPSKRTF